MKILKLFLLILISLTFSNQVFSEDKILESLKEGGKIIFIRHAYAPGGGDPENFNINDCSTQRNLNEEGITQSKLIGEFFKTKKLSKYFIEYHLIPMVAAIWSMPFNKAKEMPLKFFLNFLLIMDCLNLKIDLNGTLFQTEVELM